MQEIWEAGDAPSKFNCGDILFLGIEHLIKPITFDLELVNALF